MPLNCGWPIDEIIVIIVCCHTGTYDYREMTSDRFMFLMTAVVMEPLGSPFLSAPPTAPLSLQQLELRQLRLRLRAPREAEEQEEPGSLPRLRQPVLTGQPHILLLWVA